MSSAKNGASNFEFISGHLANSTGDLRSPTDKLDATTKDLQFIVRLHQVATKVLARLGKGFNLCSQRLVFQLEDFDVVHATQSIEGPKRCQARSVKNPNPVWYTFCMATPEQARRYRAKNKEKIKESDKIYRMKNAKALKERQRQYYQLNKEKIRADRVEHLEESLLRQARTRAKKFGLEFNIELSDISIPSTCPVLGIPIFRDSTQQTKSHSPSIDRIDNSRGYVKGNVAVISFRANTLKSDGTTEDFEKILTYMKGNKDERADRSSY